MTKAEEKAMLAEMIEGCQEGYVKGILESIHMEANRAIDSDFVFVDLGAQMREIIAGREELRKTHEALAAVKAEIRTKEQTISHLNNGLNELRTLAKRYAAI